MVSDFLAPSAIPDPHNVRLKLWVNGKLRQDFSTDGLFHKIQDQIAHLSKYTRLQEGDMILTGTGDGIDFIKPGDKVDSEMSVDGQVLMKMSNPVQ